MKHVSSTALPQMRAVPDKAWTTVHSER